MADKIKIAVAVALLVAGIAAFYYWDQSPLIARVGAVIGGTVAAVVVFWTSAPGKEFFAYAQESIDETKRVVWPTRKETLQTTGVVFAFVFLEERPSTREWLGILMVGGGVLVLALKK